VERIELEWIELEWIELEWIELERFVVVDKHVDRLVVVGKFLER
jgi:hypothetical protein